MINTLEIVLDLWFVDIDLNIWTLNLQFEDSCLPLCALPRETTSMYITCILWHERDNYFRWLDLPGLKIKIFLIIVERSSDKESPVVYSYKSGWHRSGKVVTWSSVWRECSRQQLNYILTSGHCPQVIPVSQQVLNQTGTARYDKYYHLLKTFSI